MRVTSLSKAVAILSRFVSMDASRVPKSVGTTPTPGRDAMEMGGASTTGVIGFGGTGGLKSSTVSSCKYSGIEYGSRGGSFTLSVA